HDLLYRHQDALDEPHLLRYAHDLGLDRDALAAALRDGTYRALVDEVKEGGEESGIPGTPAFFLNGVLFEEEPTEANLAHAIDWLLAHGGHT
ncbi:MAG: thioredoxin domain-containing protein, partial [Vulcanimicrobiaceae bacterium]